MHVNLLRCLQCIVRSLNTKKNLDTIVLSSSDSILLVLYVYLRSLWILLDIYVGLPC